MTKRFSLYGGEVTGQFFPDSRFRYVITDPVMGLVDKRVRGVTTVLGEILDKPGLRLWARDEMAKMLFGLEFDDDGKPTYVDKKALLTPGVAYDEKAIQGMLDQSFNAYTIKTDRGKDIGTMTHDFVARYLAGEVNGITPADIQKEYPDAPQEFIFSVTKAFNGFVKWWNNLTDKEVIGSENIIYSRKYEFSGTYDLKARIGEKVYMLDLKTTNRSQGAPLGIYPEYFMQLGGYIQADEEESNVLVDDCGILNVGKDGRLGIITASDMGLTVGDCKDSFISAVTIHNWLSKVSKLTGDSKFASHLLGE